MISCYVGQDRNKISIVEDMDNCPQAYNIVNFEQIKNNDYSRITFN